MLGKSTTFYYICKSWQCLLVRVQRCEPRCFFSHKKVLSGRQQQQSKSSWPLSGLPWHTKYRGFLVMEFATIFLTCKPPLVYCMYFTAMEPCYSYRESTTKWHWSNWWFIYSVSWVSLDHGTSGLELEVLSCLEAAYFFLNSSDLIFDILA